MSKWEIKLFVIHTRMHKRTGWVLEALSRKHLMDGMSSFAVGFSPSLSVLEGESVRTNAGVGSVAHPDIWPPQGKQL